MDIGPFVNSGIIEPEELQELLQKSGAVKVIDATFALPNSDKDPKADFKKERIDGALFFDIDEIADQDTNLPHMLPTAKEFSRAVAALGISNDDFVVAYAQHGMVMGPARAWWMFKTFGHDNVAVLNGGLPAWKTAKLPLNNNEPGPPMPAKFEAHLNTNLVFDRDQVETASESGLHQIIDARPAGRFAGSEPEPRPGLESGHIKGSINVPCSAVIDANTGKLKPEDELEKLFSEAGFNAAKPTINSCGSGVTACMDALALYHCGHKSAIGVYDGSWTEWAQKQ